MSADNKDKEETITRFTLGGAAGETMLGFFRAGTELMNALKLKIDIDMKNNVEMMKLKGQVDTLQRKVQSLDSRVGRKPTPFPTRAGVKSDMQTGTKPHAEEPQGPPAPQHDAVVIKRANPKEPLTQRPFEKALAGKVAEKTAE